MPRPIPAPDSEDTPAKRMRLGTKSCAECRRRKVRCIFPGTDTVCKECTLHGVDCRAQQPKAKEPLDDGSAVMKKRLEELEQTVRKLSNALESNSRSSSEAIEASAKRQLVSSPLASTPAWTDRNYSGPSTTPSLRTTIDNPSTPRTSFQEAARGIDHVDAPLIHLFKNAMLVQKDAAPLSPVESIQLDSAPRIRDILQRMAPFIPSPDNLEIILAATERYWLIWPSYSLSPATSDRLQPGNVAESAKILYNALGSARPGLMAKAATWLALCVQQLSKDTFAQVRPSVSQDDLIDLYLDFGKQFIYEDDENGGSQDGFETMNLLYKAYINMGRPRRAWNWIRRAVLSGTNLGIHRTSPADPYRNMMWMMTWGPERILSLMLGLPSSVSSSYPGTSEDLVGPSAFDHLIWRMSTIAGKVIDRDQSRQNSNYATTVHISQELEEARDLFPEEWWTKPPPDLSTAEIWNLQAVKFLYFVILKHTHLPYMLKARKDKRYNHSWDMAMEASRNAARVYHDLRMSSQEEPSLCRLQDFQAFSAVMVLIVGHLTSPDRSDTLTKERDWELARTMELALRHTANVLNCKVSSQAARTLEVLKAARHGGYIADEDYLVTIPYFGKLRINRDAVTGSSSLDLPVGGDRVNVSNIGTLNSPNNRPLRAGNTNSTGLDAAAMVEFFNSVEFSTTEFSQDLPLKVDYTTELCTDWADPNLLEAEYNFDWTENFLSETRLYPVDQVAPPTAQ